VILVAKGDFRDAFDLTGRVALVTGAAGILGPHFCEALADHGADVAVADLDSESARRVADQIASTYGVKTIGMAVDVSDPASVKMMAEQATAALGPIEILLSNAATKGPDVERFLDPPERYTMEAWRNVMAVNLDGMFLVAREIGSRMASRGVGSIIQTSSIYGVLAPDQRIYEGSSYVGRPINTPPVYAASKAGVVGLTRYFAAYWGHKGVRVNTLVPGGVESGQNDEFVTKYSARVPLNRMARPHDLTGALIFLASDASSYVTGQSLVVDGGLSVW
jgi:NAD(P)-dependent dehydrogenase (short-subunit alcohol dehydrogenase family)